jgi:hypothetical protein
VRGRGSAAGGETLRSIAGRDEGERERRPRQPGPGRREARETRRREPCRADRAHRGAELARLADETVHERKQRRLVRGEHRVGEREPRGGARARRIVETGTERDEKAPRALALERSELSDGAFGSLDSIGLASRSHASRAIGEEETFEPGQDAEPEIVGRGSRRVERVEPALVDENLAADERARDRDLEVAQKGREQLVTSAGRGCVRAALPAIRPAASMVSTSENTTPMSGRSARAWLVPRCTGAQAGRPRERS